MEQHHYRTGAACYTAATGPFEEHSSNVTLRPILLVTDNYRKSRSPIESGFFPVGDDMYLEHVGDGEGTPALRT